MLTLSRIQPQSSTVVSFESHRQQRPIDFVGEIVIEEYDSNEYVFEIVKNDDASLLAAALSCRSVSIYDNNMMLLRSFKGHGGTVHDVMFASQDVVLSACEDKIVRGWDVRSNSQIFAIHHDDEVMNMSLGCGGTMLATAAGMGAHFIDLRTSQRIGHYSDNHTDVVTQVCFNNNGTEIATGSEDGLVCIYDTRQSRAEESLLSVLNADCAVRKVGFFAPGGEGVFVLTGSETLSLWHKETAQCINPQNTDVRPILASMDVSVDYLVQCHFDAVSNKLLLTAADWNGTTTICEVSDSNITPTSVLNGGHRAMVRCSLYDTGRLVTGGEDSLICVWDTTQSATIPSVSGGNAKRPGIRTKKGGGRERQSEGREERSPY